MKKRALVWLRRDLRLHDHSALSLATQVANEVACVFIFDTTILGELEEEGDRRVSFIHRSLEELDAQLRKRGSALLVRHGDPVEEIPAVAKSLGCELVVAARDFEPSAIERDRRVGERVELQLVLDHVVQAGDEIDNQSGLPFRVFTPFSKAWKARQTPEMIAERKPDHLNFVAAQEIEKLRVDWSLSNLGFKPSSLWLEPGEAAARRRLKEFVPKMGPYRQMRDFPVGNHTSALSVHLRFGTISVRECFRKSMETPGAEKWIDELIWREFYSMILCRFPHVVKTTFQEQYADLEWPGTRQLFDRWVEGTTGYPIVDAAMRCIKATGWMHNRLRMVVASFLTKDLLCDYKWGEAYFARVLLDFDLASNNGGWQWAGSVGADPQPYFRVFNPILQSKKFDPKGEFIREWCPELAKLPDDQIHMPTRGLFDDLDYPAPIVDHDVQRKRAVELYRIKE